MSRHAPVKNTCPDIDSIIKTVEAIIGQMEYHQKKSEDDDLQDDLRSWCGDLSDLTHKRGELETLRESNAKLRDWGHEMASDAESLEEQLEEKQRIIDDLEGQLRYSRDEADELREQVEELNKINQES